MMLKFCMEFDISTADGKLIKKIKKKYKEKKSHAEDRTQILTKLTAIFKYLRHPQKLVQNNNWCSMVFFLENLLKFNKKKTPT